jgi:hypothetical protein
MWHIGLHGVDSVPRREQLRVLKCRQPTDIVVGGEAILITAFYRAMAIKALAGEQ